MSRKDVMLAYKFSDARLERWNFPKEPVLVQPKINGCRCRVLLWDGDARLLSSQGNEITSVPHLTDQLKWLSRQFTGRAELDGELYRRSMKLQDIRAIVSRTVNPHPDSHVIDYYIFDVINGLDVTPDSPMFKRLKALNRLNSLIVGDRELTSLRVVPTMKCYDYGRLDGLIVEYLSRGYEGVILRKHDHPYERKKSLGLMKYKPTERLFAFVQNVYEEVDLSGRPKGRLGALECKEGRATPPFKVGTGFASSQRDELWQFDSDGIAEVVGRQVEVKYQERSKSGKPIHPVFVRFI